MDWLANSLNKVWEAYRDGLIYACPDHRSADCIAQNTAETRTSTSIVATTDGNVRTVVASQTVIRTR